MEDDPESSRQKTPSKLEHANEIYQFALKLVLFPISSVLRSSSSTTSTNTFDILDSAEKLPSPPLPPTPFIPFHRPTSFHLQDQRQAISSTSITSTQSQSYNSHDPNNSAQQHSSTTLSNLINLPKQLNSDSKVELVKLNDSKLFGLESRRLSEEEVGMKQESESSLASSEKGLTNRASIVQYAIYRTSLKGHSQIQSSCLARASSSTGGKPSESSSGRNRKGSNLFSDQEKNLLEVIGILFGKNEEEILDDYRIMGKRMMEEGSKLDLDQVSLIHQVIFIVC